MAEEQVSDKQLIEALLRERDELYRRATKAEHRLAELSDAEAMRQQYEARIKEKDNEISQMKADHQKRLSKMDDEYKKVLSKKEPAMGTGTWGMRDKFKFYQKNLEV